MKKKYVSRLLAGCLTVTMLTPTGALASVPQPVVTQEASQVAGQENETENKEQAEEYAAEGAAEVQTDETEAAENRTAADKSREQTEPQTAQTGEQAEPQTTQTGEQAVSEAEPQVQVQPRAVVDVNQWIRNGKRWWYRHADGSYTTNGWEVINGAWYYFDGAGWMVTGWLKRASGWYYLEPGNGNMVTGWRKIGSTWYYLNPGNGDMATGWTTIGGTRYYMNQDGAMVEGWSQQNGTWYYLKPGSGNIATGWLKLGATWYYLASDGKMLTGFQNIGGSKYYLNTGSGAMAVGWLQLGSDWYYMDGSGAMLTGWQKIGSTWYYLNPTTGKMATGWTTVGGSKYYMNGSGAMLTDWQNIDGSEYYFYSSGAMAVSTVIGGVEIGADGKASRTESQAIGTLTKFLKTMIQPVGNTLYVWGGGHDAWTDGDGLRIGMNPKWKQFYNQQGASYNYTKHRYEYQNGLDCSGLVSWAVYNTYNTKSNQKETAYSSTSTGFPAYLTNKGFGSHGKVSGGTFTPGDVVSMTGHVWVVLGMCSDGSLVIVHATPPVVQISGTVNTAGSTNSEAVKLAKAYMKKYYSDAAGKYNLCIASKAYVNNVDRFQWSSSSMRDPDGLRNMTAAQVLEKLIGPQ